MAKFRSETVLIEDEICGCDFEIEDAEATPDEGLPASLGGIAVEGEGDEVCGCDVDIDEMDATADEDLPVATGGVA